MEKDFIKLFTDGSSRGNPGYAGAGIVFKNSNNEILICARKFLGTNCTNNEAEYKSLNLGLEIAFKQGYSNIEIYLDSQLIVRQLTGIYQIKNVNLYRFFRKAKLFLLYFNKYIFYHICRQQNFFADRLANLAIDDFLKKK